MFILDLPNDADHAMVGTLEKIWTYSISVNQHCNRYVYLNTGVEVNLLDGAS